MPTYNAFFPSFTSWAYTGDGTVNFDTIINSAATAIPYMDYIPQPAVMTWVEATVPPEPEPCSEEELLEFLMEE